ncbi:MAG TPA: alpha/beta fold hydrolase [Syntrophorhabdaceae bacterium]|nr:alpha/beta fold hydrolase [Syntrophorhabdaceae bacterium]HQM81691.1 alpha/beta fold hydrolase [Syntrophorhabdaceae bacterium]
MPTVKVNDINMYHEIHGEGEPLVLINGAGAGVELLYWRIPKFSREYTLILFDNRGAGRSDRPEMAYTTELMADDLAGLFDVVGIDSAHVYGTSMGGMIAQHFALRYPEKVRSLILAVTCCGGPHSIKGPIVGMAHIHELPLEKAVETMLRWFVTEEFIDGNPDTFRQIVAFMIKHPPVHSGLPRHTQAVATHDTYDRLPEIAAPTLVLAGDADRIIPVGNATILASRIPNAELAILKNAGHMLIEAADDVDRITLDFLKRHRTEN